MSGAIYKPLGDFSPLVGEYYSIHKETLKVLSREVQGRYTSEVVRTESGSRFRLGQIIDIDKSIKVEQVGRLRA